MWLLIQSCDVLEYSRGLDVRERDKNRQLLRSIKKLGSHPRGTVLILILDEKFTVQISLIEQFQDAGFGEDVEYSSKSTS